MNLDVVIPYRENGSEELRYTLRGLKNIPHRKVWVCGDETKFNVNHIPVSRSNYKYASAAANINAAVDYPEVSEDFILMADDIFILKPITYDLNRHRGDSYEVAKLYSGSYGRALKRTLHILEQEGIESRRCYELHTPFIVNKERKREVTKLKSKYYKRLETISFRTLYGNLYQIGGRYQNDVKVYKDEKLPKKIISTTEQSFKGKAGDYIKSILTEPSEYELW